MSAKPRSRLYVARKQRPAKPKMLEVKVTRTDEFPPVLHEFTVVSAQPKPAPRPDREGKRPLHVYLPESMHRHLRQMALDHDTNITMLTLEALTDLFAKKRKA